MDGQSLSPRLSVPRRPRYRSGRGRGRARLQLGRRPAPSVHKFSSILLKLCKHIANRVLAQIPRRHCHNIIVQIGRDIPVRMRATVYPLRTATRRHTFHYLRISASGSGQAVKRILHPHCRTAIIEKAILHNPNLYIRSRSVAHHNLWLWYSRHPGQTHSAAVFLRSLRSYHDSTRVRPCLPTTPPTQPKLDLCRRLPWRCHLHLGQGGPLMLQSIPRTPEVVSHGSVTLPWRGKTCLRRRMVSHYLSPIPDLPTTGPSNTVPTIS